ncbi:MAG: hypothetical protein HKP29_14975 [Silicimonas sp.]|nr:hypothetical protein [Silicimonas sp.]NNL74659.1 hypothetical protein [Silicimonas sp.]
MKRVVSGALILLVGYLAWAALMTWAHPRLIYPFFPDPVDLPGFREVGVAMPDGTEIALQVSEGEGPTILYFMGNAGALQLFADSLAAHQGQGRRVVALEYRGGGGRPGTPSEAALKRDALAAADHALSYGDPVVIHAYSLGSGLAVHVAARRTVAGLILEAPFSRLCALMARAAFLPACIMPLVQRWDTLGDAPDVSAPVLILHGANDRLIPPANSVALDAALGRSRRVVVEGADHLDIGLNGRTWREIVDFMHEIRP